MLFNQKMSSQIDVWFQNLFSMLVADRRGATKKTFKKHLLKEGNWLIHSTPQKIILWYTKHQPDLLTELTKILPTIEYVQGISSEVDSMFDRSVNNLIILDDMMDEAMQDKRISHFFTRGRHDNLSVIYLTQNLCQNFQWQKSTLSCLHSKLQTI